MPTDSSIGLVVFAVGTYLPYCLSLIQSIISNAENRECWNFYVFTDQPEVLDSFELPYINRLSVIRVNCMSFPEASLMRYELLTQHFQHSPPTEDVLVFSDADMLVVDHPERIVQTGNSRPTFVLHPGFWRPPFAERVKLYLSTPQILMIDLYLVLRFGGIGTWETNSSSSAHVRRRLRRQYFCGGFWFADRQCFMWVCEQIASSIQRDRRIGIMARWHDESHLNAFATKNLKNVLDSSYCFEPTYPQLKTLPPTVIAIDKSKAADLG